MSTTINTGWLRNKAGEKFAPKTLTSQVQTSDGILLEDKIQADINRAIEAIPEVPVTSVNGQTGDVTINIPTSLKNPNALTFGSKAYDGSSAQTIIAADLGLSNALHFIGTVTSLPASATNGDVVLMGSKEYVYSNGWIELGDGDSHALKTITISAGSGLTGGGNLSANRTISHADTSNVTNVTANGRTYVTGLTFDGFGHVTAVTTGTETVVNTDTGATSVETTGTGNAVTSASYNSSNRKLTLTKGETYATDSQLSNTYNKITSKSEQLIVNGSGLMGNNTNFSSLTFDGAVANNSSGSFTYASGKKITLYTDEFFPINPEKKYKIDIDAKTKNGLATMYSFLDFYDADKQQINVKMHVHNSASTTTLAKDLKAGDTVIYLTDSSGWSTTYNYGFYMAVWNHTNSFGYTYPAGTYTRNRITLPKTSSNKLDSNCINFTNHTITLTGAYSGTTIPAGTPVSQGGDAATYKYGPLSNTVVPVNWKTYTGYMSGVDTSGTNAVGMFPPAVAYCKIGFLWNNNTAADQVWITNVSVTDVSNIPSKLPNPNALTFTGAVTGTYDGSSAKTVNIPENTDTGATSVEVTGTGNAITAASYDAATRKLTLTKGATYSNNSGDITGVTAGNGLTGGGASGSVTLAVGAGDGITVAANTVSVSYGTSAAALGTSSAGSAKTVSRSDHVHALPALTSCTGTLTVAKGGTGYTTLADTTYTTARYRGSSLHKVATTPTVNGTICWTYE